MCCCLWEAGIFGEKVVDLELKLVGLMVQSLDQEQRPSDTRREVFGVGQEVGQSRSQVGIDLSAGIQLHGHVEVFHLCSRAFDASQESGRATRNLEGATDGGRPISMSFPESGQQLALTTSHADMSTILTPPTTILTLSDRINQPSSQGNTL